MKENIQKSLDHLLAAINETSNNDPRYNHIIGLNLINRKGCVSMSGKPLPDGKYVRVVWSDNPDRNDGYYDVCVEGDNCFGVLSDVFRYLNKTL